ncbi:MAG: capsule assembly Wzi family protein [Gemmatirosa sp.]
MLRPPSRVPASLLLGLASAVSAGTLGAQAGRLAHPAPTWLETVTGGALEEYLRAAQLDTSRSRPYLQTVRNFGVAEVRRMLRSDSAGPWNARLATPPVRGVQVTLLRPGARLAANSTFPFGLNDGALWAGRGLAFAADAGVVVLAGPLTVRVQPSLVWAQNASFRLFDDSRTGSARYADPVQPGSIDLPQRFGDGMIARLDYGESEIRLDALGFAAGLSNASQSWGPATTHALILGPNAPGFAHAFVGTGRPLAVGIGRVHARLIVGRLDESAWSPAPDSLRRRLGAGLIATFAPRWPSGLELGVTRFSHRRWRGGEIPWDGWRVPLEGLLFKKALLDIDDPTSRDFLVENQLASAFARWALPAAKVEVYGELARDDAALDLRELITEPDHQAFYTLGLRKLLDDGPQRMRLVRAEYVNARITHLQRVRPQSLFYVHSALLQGHTNRGQVLGSAAVRGGGGAVVGFDTYDPRGRTRLELHRIARLAPVAEGASTPEELDVQYAASYERLRFRVGMDLSLGATAIWEINRDFRGDAFNLNLTLGARFGRRAATR